MKKDYYCILLSSIVLNPFLGLFVQVNDLFIELSLTLFAESAHHGADPPFML